MDNQEQRAGWTVSGSHAVLTADFVGDLQAALDELMYARNMGDHRRADVATLDLHILINEEIGQPATRAAG
tara:strand:- start:401 stop:613 length:213 start_codon:yes stop_codon:yes gene_type:complete